MVKPRNRYLIYSYVCIAGLMATWHRPLHAALPPAAVQPQEGDTNASVRPDGRQGAPSLPGRTPRTETIFMLPPVRVGGKVSFEVRSDASEGQKIVQQSITSTLIAKTDTHLWQPWFATLSGEIGLSVLRYHVTNDTRSSAGQSRSDSGAESLTSKNLVTTGTVRLNLVPRSKFPFEAHFVKNDSRITGTLSSLSGYSSQNLGFTQNFVSPLGHGLVGFDRNEQHSDANGDTQQDNLRLSLSKALTPEQNLQVEGTLNDNTQKFTGERAKQGHLSVQHRFSNGRELNVDSIANLNKTDYRLAQGRNDVGMAQLNSFGFWRPDEGKLTMSGGVRVMTLENSSSNAHFDGASSTSRMSDMNVNLGANYDYTKAVRLSAGANLNIASAAGDRTLASSQSAGISYQPESRAMGEYRYDWSTSGTVTNNSGGAQVQGQAVSMQIGHGLSRSLQLSAGSSLSTSVSQSLSSLILSGGGSTNHLTHSGSLSWNLASEGGRTYTSLSGSDSRSMGDQNESFQMINLQVSRSMPTGRFTSWNGNLTIQAVNQQSTMKFFSEDRTVVNKTERSTVTSTGSISYENQRVFGVPRLRFISDLRLNSQALLPVLGGPQDQETAAWENNLNYSIGRTQFRTAFRLAKAGGKNNTSIVFTVTRGLGDF